MANNDIGIDLGTTSIIIYAEGKGIVCKEPSVVALNKKNGKILAIGQKAFEMVGKTPAHIVAEKPLENGVISDIDMTEEIVKFFIKKVSSSFIVKPRVAICVPSAVLKPNLCPADLTLDTFVACLFPTWFKNVEWVA